MDLLATIKADDEARALADSGNDAAVAERINATATETRLKPFVAADIYGVIEPASAGKLLAWSNLSLVMADIAKQDRAALGVWATALSAATILTPQDAAAILGVLQATEQVPASVSHEQVSAVLNAVRPRGDFYDDGKFTANPESNARALPIDWNSI